MPEFIPITWGGIRVWATSIDTEGGRNVIVHDLTQGDEHPTHDTGQNAKRTRMSILFDDFPGETEEPTVRARRFQLAVNTGAEAVLTHPLFGSYQAKVGQCSMKIDEHGVISGDVEFIPTEAVRAVSPAGAGAPGVAGEASVNAAADEHNAAMDRVSLLLDLEDSPAVTASAAVATWNEGETVPTRQIIADTADISNSLARMIDEQGLEDDLALFDVYRATIMLGEAVRSAAIAATSETPAVFVMRVTTPVSLLPLCARTYGGAEAEDRERQVRELNDIRTPGWFGPGELLMPVRPTNRSAF